MNVLILTCGTGGGHNSAAYAILEEMKKRNCNVELLNPYMLKSKKLASFIDNSYISMVQKTPKAFGVLYSIGEVYRKLPFRSPIYFVNRAMNNVVEEYLAKNNFDIIICTHFLGAEILTNMKEHGIKVPTTIFVATDYICTPFSEETNCNAYVIPAHDLMSEFSGRGIPKEKIYPLGIPVHSNFSKNETRNEIKKRLSLDENKNYILITGGSMGGGKIERTISTIQYYFSKKENIKLIIVCGNNEKLYKNLKNRNYPNTIIIGHTNDMSSYIKACDLFITKPGGLSSTEAAVCGVPILHTAAIPGCETYNAKYFAERGMSISGNISNEFLQSVYEIISDSNQREIMISNQKKHINSYAASDICDLADRIAVLQ